MKGLFGLCGGSIFEGEFYRSFSVYVRKVGERDRKWRGANIG